MPTPAQSQSEATTLKQRPLGPYAQKEDHLRAPMEPPDDKAIKGEITPWDGQGQGIENVTQCLPGSQQRTPLTSLTDQATAPGHGRPVVRPVVPPRPPPKDPKQRVTILMDDTSKGGGGNALAILIMAGFFFTWATLN